MATVTTLSCDGCDKPLDSRGQREFVIKGYDHNGKSLFLFGPLDVCGDCLDRLQKESNVKSWTRTVEPG
jgi:hypothetical protein